MKRESAIGIALVSPTLILTALLIGVPAVYVVWLSLTSKHLLLRQADFVGLANYLRVLQDSSFWSALKLSFVWMFANWAIQLILGLGIALLLNQKFVGRTIIRGIVLFPYVIPTIVAILLIKWIFSETYGVSNYILLKMGMIKKPIQWFTAPSLAMTSLIGIGVWKYFPFMTIVILARLQTIDPELYSAANVDGASVFQQFRYITLPEISGVIIFISLLRCIWMFNMFDIIWLTSRGGPIRATTTLPVYSYIKAFKMQQYAVGCTIAIIATAFMIVGTLLFFRIALGKEET